MTDIRSHHKEVHKKDLPVCNLCPAVVQRNFKAHVKFHGFEEYCKLQSCMEMFKTKKELEDHQEEEHPELFCTGCRNLYKNENTLKIHSYNCPKEPKQQK